jgi:hypothetical protein
MVLIVVVIRGMSSKRSFLCSHGSGGPENISTCTLAKNRKEKGRVKQQVIATLGRMETLIRSLPRFS